MTTVAMSGNDTIIINNRLITDLADNNVIEMTFPNNIAAVKTGKNGNTIYSFNSTGKVCEIKMRLLRASSDDKFFNGLLISQNLNFAAFPLMIGQFIKKVGDGEGNITSDTYVMRGGAFIKQVETKSNVEGDTEQSISLYTMQFGDAPRAIG